MVSKELVESYVKELFGFNKKITPSVLKFEGATGNTNNVLYNSKSASFILTSVSATYFSTNNNINVVIRTPKMDDVSLNGLPLIELTDRDDLLLPCKYISLSSLINVNAGVFFYGYIVE